MNVQAKFPDAIAFNAYAAYQREREHSRRMESYLSKALMLLSMQCGQQEIRGKDMSDIREFIREASQ